MNTIEWLQAQATRIGFNAGRSEAERALALAASSDDLTRQNGEDQLEVQQIDLAAASRDGMPSLGELLPVVGDYMQGHLAGLYLTQIGDPDELLLDANLL